MLNLIPYALAAIGGYQGYRSARDAGASGLGALTRGAIGAYGGYTLGAGGLSALSPKNYATFAETAPFINMPGMPGPQQTIKGVNPLAAERRGTIPKVTKEPPSIIDALFRKDSKPGGEIDPLKLALTTGGGLYALGAFDQAPADIYMPGYNMSYLEMAKQRGNYKYIDPETGQEKEYEEIYKPEEQGKDDRRLGPYQLVQQRLAAGGLAEIKKFNEGGINYLPSKVSHDENDSNNYVRATGYVEDGSGAGDKDEDTMLAQLADGEFVTRADGVLGAGIIAGGNPNSIKDMREKGAQYFYEQQKRYKRVFDLLKESNGNSKQKEN